jgi:hypothetical protein
VNNKVGKIRVISKKTNKAAQNHLNRKNHKSPLKIAEIEKNDGYLILFYLKSIIFLRSLFNDVIIII